MLASHSRVSALFAPVEGLLDNRHRALPALAQVWIASSVIRRARMRQVTRVSWARCSSG